MTTTDLAVVILRVIEAVAALEDEVDAMSLDGDGEGGIGRECGHKLAEARVSLSVAMRCGSVEEG